MKKHFTFLIMVYCCVAIQAQPRLVRKLRQNHITGAWKDTSDIVFTYNSGGQTLLRTYNGLWVSGTIPGWKDSSVYNTSGQLDTTYVFNWNDSASRFDSLPGGVLAYQYNTSGNLLKIVRYYPTINRTFIDSFVYNSSGWVAEMITIEPDSPWVDYNYKIEYTYNSAGQVLTEIQYYSGPNWIPQNKYESIYISGQLTERQYFRWNNNTTQWDSSQHSSYTYTAGKLTEEIQDRVFGPGTKIKVTYSYNSFGLIEEELYLFYDPPSSSYVNGWKEIYYYASTTGIANVNKTSFTFYPNPSVGIFTIQHDFTGDIPLTVYDMAGRKVFAGNCSGKNSLINLQHLEKGIYLLQLHAGGVVETQRIVIE